jgi:hypothetical protein
MQHLIMPFIGCNALYDVNAISKGAAERFPRPLHPLVHLHPPLTVIICQWVRHHVLLITSFGLVLGFASGDLAESPLFDVILITAVLICQCAICRLGLRFISIVRHSGVATSEDIGFSLDEDTCVHFLFVFL